nr:hypothetical protein [Jiangella aurantiaca]
MPLTEVLLPAAVQLCAGGLRRLAAGMNPSLGVMPGMAAEALAEITVRGLLDAEPDRPAWAVTDGATVLASAGATVTTLTPDDPRYTLMPPRSVTLTRSALHNAPGSVAACFPLLVDQARQVADRLGRPWTDSRRRPPQPSGRAGPGPR